VAFTLKLPAPWESRGWKAKIRDRERVEPPHVTIMHKTKAWRFGLHTQQFLDAEPDPREIPDEVLEGTRAGLSLLRQAWDRMYPKNPIVSKTPKKPKAKRKHK
jgi:hypothetical protein